MVIESIATQPLQAIFLAVTRVGRSAAVENPFGVFPAAEGWLIDFAMAALIMALILVFFQSASRRGSYGRSLDRFRHQIAELKSEIDKLRQGTSVPSQDAPVKPLERMPSHAPQERVGIAQS